MAHARCQRRKKKLIFNEPSFKQARKLPVRERDKAHYDISSDVTYSWRLVVTYRAVQNKLVSESEK